MKKSIVWLAVVSLLTLGAGCGYRLVGGGFIKNDITRVSVSIFGNNSTESRAGIAFTNELTREILATTDTVVVEAGNAGHSISGTVQSITFSTLSRSSSEDVTERRVNARVDVVLTGVDGKIVWSVKNFSASESYSVSSNSVDDEANKRAAIDLIAERVAESIVARMLDDF